MEQAVSPKSFGVNPEEPRNDRSGALDPSASSPPPQQTLSASPQSKALAKRYARVKITLGITGTVLYILLLVFLVVTGATSRIEAAVRGISQNDYIALLLFVAVIGLLGTVLSAPLKYYSGFYLEHKYHLTTQRFRAWVWEGVKGMLVGLSIGVPLLLAFYYCLRSFGGSWWLAVGTLLFLLSVVLARLAPILIFPLFYKFRPLEEGALKEAILHLCREAGMSVKGVFVFDLSKNTKKANAAFAGIGKSRRIILGDTLIANFTDEEIETVVAHELGHFRLKHIWVMLAIGAVNSFLGLFVTAELYRVSLSWFGFTGIDQLAALPLLSLWLGAYSLVTGPLSNMLSRAHERAADRYAARTSGKSEAFANALRKLAAINLADTSPHPLVEFLFHSHPSIEKRIAAVERQGG
jgi:STE24 endopeptidase